MKLRAPKGLRAAVARFLTHVEDCEGGCCEWTGAVSWRFRKLPHGKFKLDGRSRYAHRLALAWSMGLHDDSELPPGVVRHRCDNARCVNPRHLKLGTVAENNRDIVERGRHVAHRGEWHPRCKLSDAAVAAIRAGEASARALAAEHGVSASYVRQLRAGARRAA